jgi:hypothetical protein
VSDEREQNWFPIGKVGWFTQHIREGIEVTAEQLGLLQPALTQPYRLGDATVARIMRVHRDLAAAEQLKPVTIETLLARSDLEVGIEALLRGWPGTGLSSNGAGQWWVAPKRSVPEPPHCPFPAYLVWPGGAPSAASAAGCDRCGWQDAVQRAQAEPGPGDLAELQAAQGPPGVGGRAR